MHERLKETIHRIASLEADFNGYNAAPIPRIVLETAARFIDLLPADVPDIGLFPTGRESVQFEYDAEIDDYFEVEIFSNEIVFYSQRDGVDETAVVDLETAVQKFLNKEPT